MQRAQLLTISILKISCGAQGPPTTKMKAKLGSTERATCIVTLMRNSVVFPLLLSATLYVLSCSGLKTEGGVHHVENGSHQQQQKEQEQRDNDTNLYHKRQNIHDYDTRKGLRRRAKKRSTASSSQSSSKVTSKENSESKNSITAQSNTSRKSSTSGSKKSSIPVFESKVSISGKGSSKQSSPVSSPVLRPTGDTISIMGQITAEYIPILVADPLLTDVGDASELTCDHFEMTLLSVFAMGAPLVLVQSVTCEAIMEGMNAGQITYKTTVRFDEDSGFIPSPGDVAAIMCIALDPPAVNQLLVDLRTSLDVSNPFAQTSQIQCDQQLETQSPTSSPFDLVSNDPVVTTFSSTYFPVSGDRRPILTDLVDVSDATCEHIVDVLDTVLDMGAPLISLDGNPECLAISAGTANDIAYQVSVQFSDTSDLVPSQDDIQAIVCAALAPPAVNTFIDRIQSNNLRSNDFSNPFRTTSSVSCDSTSITTPPQTERTIPPSPIPTTTIPTQEPTQSPTKYPTFTPTISPTITPTISPTISPTITPTISPTITPTLTPTISPTGGDPSIIPTQSPTSIPTATPSQASDGPTVSPQTIVTNPPVELPTDVPIQLPTNVPTETPTEIPVGPTVSPQTTVTNPPIELPTDAPTQLPTRIPTEVSVGPTASPQANATNPPTQQPTAVSDSPVLDSTTIPTSVPTVVADMPTNAPTQSPVPNARFDITYDFDGIPVADLGFFESARILWESIITGDLEDVDSATIPADPKSPGCSYPAIIDDLYVCVLFSTLPDGIAGQGGFSFTRTGTLGLPLIGFVQLDTELFETAKSFNILDVLILHELGHALGLGTLDFCPGDGSSRANDEYQALSGCTTNVPVQVGCSHFQEECLSSELMTPTISASVDNALSRLSVGWLEDVGYEVDYANAAEFDSSKLDAGCVCNRRELQTTATSTFSSLLDTNNDIQLITGKNQTASKKPRKLSTAGYEAAVEYGKTVLEQRAADAIGMAPGLVDSVANYVGDQFIWIYYFEDGSIHDVLVRK